MNTPLRQFDAIVIGAGLSGLTAAAVLAESGARVFLVAKGGGYLHFTSGCIDLLGVLDGAPAADPLAAVQGLVEGQGQHPYALAGADSLVAGTDLLQRIASSGDGAFVGDLHRNVTVPTAVGSTRTTCLLPPTMAAGTLEDRSPMLIVGFTAFRDFYPPFLAANLRAAVPFPLHDAYLDLPHLRGRRHLLSLDLARAFEDAGFRAEVARLVRAELHGAERVGFPAVLGFDRPAEVLTDLQSRIGCPVFEIPTLPPSVRGVRLYDAFRRWLMRHGVRIEIGFWVEGRIEGEKVAEITVQSSNRATRYRAGSYVLATGGIGGGGIRAHADGRLQETVFDLPVSGPNDRSGWFDARFVSSQSQPISLSGLRTDAQLRPLTRAGLPVLNLFAAGSQLAGWDPTREKSGEGVALATGYRAAAGAEVLTAAVNDRTAAAPAR